MKQVRLVAALLLVAASIVGFGTAAAGDDAVALSPTAESWYQPNPACGTPLGCAQVAPPPLSAYPSGTLHVGVSSGAETARSYVAFPFRNVADTITSASLTLPLDTNQLDGDTSSATAHVAVCLTFVPVVVVAGSFDAPPSTDCSSAASARYVASPTPHLVADLAPLLERLPSAVGIVVVPDAIKVTPTDSWRIVFSSHDRSDAAKTPPASISVTTARAPVPDDSATVSDDVFLPDSYTALIDPLLGVSFAAPPAADAPRLIASAPQADPGPTSGPTQIANIRYRYKAVWLLPLLLLALAPAVVKALTKDLTPRR